MKSLYWYAVILAARLLCRLTCHQNRVSVQRGYLVVWCSRCYAATVDLVQP